MNDIIKPVGSDLTSQLSHLVQVFFGGRAKGTLRIYQSDLSALATHLGLASVEALARHLVDAGHGAANLMAAEYRNHLLAKNLSSATINRKLGSLRSLVRSLRVAALISWEIEVSSLRTESFRDSKGPGEDGFIKLLAEAKKNGSLLRRARDVAILWLLYARALRRGELCALDVTDYDPANMAVWIIGKGRRERESVTISEQTNVAIQEWLNARNTEEELKNATPLFVGVSSHRGHRLTGESVRGLIASYARKAGLGVVRPHGLRHAAITTVLDATNGNVRAAQRFGRHKSVVTTQKYDDNRQDIGGSMSSLLDKRTNEPKEKE